MSITIVSRKEWQAKPPTKPFIKQGTVSEFFLHHSVSADLGDEKAEMRSIQALHQAAGARDIDYGFCLGRKGTFYEGRGWGNQDGATATGQYKIPDGNYYGREVTLCLLGNYENLILGDAQVDRIREFIALAVDLEYLHVNPRIRGHRDVRATACPGQHAYDRLKDIRVPWEKEDDVKIEDLIDLDVYDKDAKGDRDPTKSFDNPNNGKPENMRAKLADLIFLLLKEKSGGGV